MSQRYFMSEHSAHNGSYAELHLRRRRIEAQIARHKKKKNPKNKLQSLFLKFTSLSFQA